MDTWIRTKAPFDAVIDFDAAVRDPADSDRTHAPFNCDDIHLSPRGRYDYEAARSVGLDLFDPRSALRRGRGVRGAR